MSSAANAADDFWRVISLLILLGGSIVVFVVVRRIATLIPPGIGPRSRPLLTERSLYAFFAACGSSLF